MTGGPQRSADTVVARATPYGHAALGVVRLSGPDAKALAAALCPGGPAWRPRRACLRTARTGTGAVLDRVLCLWMPGPRSYTGEDVVELSCHGNPVVVQALLRALIEAGARPARPGEFTRRAVEHGRLDLVQAEAVAAVIEARSEEGLVLAQAGLGGALSAELAALRERMLDAAAELEARLDHPDEDLALVDEGVLCAGLEADADAVRVLADSWTGARRRLVGARVALVGPVNAGKSRLFNALVGAERALVSPEAGTTRDVVSAVVELGGLPIEFLDTAGARAEAAGLEAAGQVLGARLTADVDLRLHVEALPAVSAARPAADGLWVGTHLDLWCGSSPPPTDLAVSSLTGEGLTDLEARISEELGVGPGAPQQTALLSARQHARCLDVAAHLAGAAKALRGVLGPAVAAQEVVLGLECLAELDGRDVRDDVLDRLFARFCIGK